ncbi:MAG: lipoyl(octanoyl) transferase LipB [Gammaproteobacteria bacterium]|nr:lipoyl(octanoyl) transferase LipB [Gammaproteobacteria bacterium]
MTNSADILLIRELGLEEYTSVLQKMQTFNQTREPHTTDELWIVEHPPVFTLGLNGKTEHVLDAGDIPVIPVDRGGQVTYHGPGQLVIYPLLNIQRRNIGVRQLVSILEQTVIELLASYHIEAQNRADAPGVYVDDAKIAALGLRIKKGCSYHGLSLNINMDLHAFSRINPCGYAGMAVTQCSDLGIHDSLNIMSQKLVSLFAKALGCETRIV